MSNNVLPNCPTVQQHTAELRNIADRADRVFEASGNPTDIFAIPQLGEGIITPRYIRSLQKGIVDKVRNAYNVRASVLYNRGGGPRSAARGAGGGRGRRLEVTVVGPSTDSHSHVAMFTIKASGSSPPLYQSFPLIVFIEGYEKGDGAVKEILFKAPKGPDMTLPKNIFFFPTQAAYEKYTSQKLGNMSNPFEGDECIIGVEQPDHDVRITPPSHVHADPESSVIVFLFLEPVVDMEDAGLQIFLEGKIK